LAKIPDNLSFTEAAAIPEAFITAHDAIFTQGNLQESETLLIHAVGSGVGLAALQLARAKGIDVIGTTRTYEKSLKAAELGLHMNITFDKNSETDNVENLAKIIRNFNKGKGVDVILDLVGAKYFAANLESLNLKGRLILVGLTAGSKAEFNLGMALTKRAKIIGTVLRSRLTEEKAAATRKFIEDVLPLIATGKIKPNLDKVFPVEDIKNAHEYLESNASFGKVVLEF
jgi:NADPH:quinone reductase